MKSPLVYSILLLLVLAVVALAKTSRKNEEEALELIAEAIVDVALDTLKRKTKPVKLTKFANATANALSDTENNGCFKLGTYQHCLMQPGQFTFHNNGGPLNQVIVENRAQRSYLVSLVRIIRAANQPHWQEAGLAICNSQTGEGCNNNPPGQTLPGLGEIHSLSAQPNAREFLPAAEFGNVMLEIKPGHVRYFFGYTQFYNFLLKTSVFTH